jgi:carboxyl-terminal processing protease
LNKKKVIAIVAILLIVTNVSTAILTGLGVKVITGLSMNSRGASFSEIQKYNKVKSLLKGEFIENVDDNKLLEGSIRGLAESLDESLTELSLEVSLPESLEVPLEVSLTELSLPASVAESSAATTPIPKPAINIKKTDKIVNNCFFIFNTSKKYPQYVFFTTSSQIIIKGRKL